MVIEFAIDQNVLAEPVVERRPAFDFGGRYDLARERLHFLVWANTYDCRTSEPVWWHGRKAAAIGAAATPGGPADVTLPDGRAAWIDAGPRQPLPDLGHPVIHRETVESGGLTAVRSPTPVVGDLAPDQLAAVGHLAGPARVIAPAGSGKTRTLIARIRHPGRFGRRGARAHHGGRLQQPCGRRVAQPAWTERGLDTHHPLAGMVDPAPAPPRVGSAQRARRAVDWSVRWHPWDQAPIRTRLPPTSRRWQRYASPFARPKPWRATATTSPASPTSTRSTAAGSHPEERPTSTSRSLAPSRCSSPTRRYEGASRRGAGTCWWTSSRTSPPPTFSYSGWWRRPGSPSSGWVTTTR